MSLPDIDDIYRDIESVVQAMDQAEEEIAAAQHRHPAQAQALQRSFWLLRPTHDLMRTEAVYRAHCRELLERVACGEDPAPATAVECCLILGDITTQLPATTAVVGLYLRMWQRAGLPATALSDSLREYEDVAGPRLDEAEAWLRARVAHPWRASTPGLSSSPETTTG